jgi:hypothetical protein
LVGLLPNHVQLRGGTPHFPTCKLTQAAFCVL